MEHSVLPPSGISRIIACPAAAIAMREAAKLPDDPSPAALHGTKLHEVSECAVRDGRHYIDLMLPGDEEDDFADRNAVNEALDYLDKLVKKCDNNPAVALESRITLESWGIPEVWGTSDVSVDDFDHVHIIDYKYGKWPVFAEDNAQLLCYAAGRVGFPNSYKPTIHAHIIQPFVENYNEWVISYDTLSEWVFDVLTPAINKVKAGSMEFGPTEDGCRFCPAGHDCEGRHQLAVRSAQEVFKMVDAFPRMTNEQLAKALAQASEYERVIKALRTYVHKQIYAGEKFPGYKLVKGRGLRYWIDEEAAEKWLEENTTIDESKLSKSKLISPAQAEKLARALKKHKGFKALWEKKDGKPNVVPESDKRPAISLKSGAKDAFKNV